MPLLSLLPLLGFSIYLQSRLKLSASYGLILTISGWMLLTYFAGLLDLLYPTTLLIWLVGFAMALVLTIREKNCRTHLMETPYLVLLIACCVYWLLHQNSGFAYYDEFSHWGVYIREMWADGALWGADTNSVRPRYLPGASLWQYAFTVTTPKRESVAYLAQFVLLVSPLLVLFDKVTLKQVGWILAAILLITIGLVNFGHGIVSLYVDHVISTWIFGIAILIIKLFAAENVSIRDQVLLALPLASLSLLKGTAGLFAIALVFIALAVQFFNHRGGWLRTASLALPIFIVTFMWSWNRDAVGAAAFSPPGCLTSCLIEQQTESEPLWEILEDLTSSGLTQDKRTEEITRNFFSVVVNQNLSKTEADASYNEFLVERLTQPDEIIGLTTLNFLIIFICYFMLIAVAIRDTTFLRSWGVLTAGLLFTAAGYILSLWLAYLFFYEDTGHRIPSYHRFVHTITLPLYLLMIAVLMPGTGPAQLQQSLVRYIPKAGVITGVLVAYMLIIEPPYTEKLIKTQKATEKRAQVEPAALGIRQLVGDRGLLILMPDTRMSGMRDHIMLYLLAPTPTRIYRGKGLFTLDNEALSKELQNIELIWLPEIVESFDAEVSASFTQPGALRFIRVVHGESITFESVDAVEGMEPQSNN